MGEFFGVFKYLLTQNPTNKIHNSLATLDHMKRYEKMRSLWNFFFLKMPKLALQ